MSSKRFWSSKYKIITLIVLLSGGLFSLGLYLGFKINSDHIDRPESLVNTEPEIASKVDFAPFWKAWKTLDEKFVSTKKKISASAATSSASAAALTDQDKVWGAIEGLTNSLGDPYTIFFPPEESKSFETEISGNFEGVGMEIGSKNDFITVVAPLKGNPAQRAGILPGDKILAIDGQSTVNMSVDKAVKLIRGKVGTKVKITAAREGKKEPLEFELTREVINIPTVDVEIKNGQIAGGKTADGAFVIKLYNFYSTSPDLFRSALRKFIESGSDKLILDLRGNPGGYLEAAVDMASWFLPLGKVVVSEDFGKNIPSQIYRSRGYNIFNGNLKMAILVDGGSASASEILAGALKEQGIAKLVGTKTFGKGSVQEVVKITPDTSLKVTVARWLTPLGNSISENGLTPDFEVKLTQEDFAKGKDYQMDKAIEILKNSEAR
ncbi:MAG: S41 family peptidase [Patescibacteria group bacterium]|nr:S41 family peptidase [Patescibacteria group bacterium]MDE1988474.1 S41 family peptidase [Patescibacteria group bacterium]MDE2218340.1 S41 family peptidase [Patescibacteria group bacterium]